MNLSMIVAADTDGIIAVDGGIPWNCKKDLKRFKKLTKNRVVIMGRKTYDTLDAPLENRFNAVLTRDTVHSDIIDAQQLTFSDITAFYDVFDLINWLQDYFRLDNEDYECDDIFIIGGVEIYKLFFGLVNKIYYTEIHHEETTNLLTEYTQLPLYMQRMALLCNSDFNCVKTKEYKDHTYYIFERDVKI